MCVYVDIYPGNITVTFNVLRFQKKVSMGELRSCFVNFFGINYETKAGGKKKENKNN